MSKERVMDIWRSLTQAEKDQFGSFEQFKRWMGRGGGNAPTEPTVLSEVSVESAPSSQTRPRTHRVPRK
jgi:hypothetical protein